MRALAAYLITTFCYDDNGIILKLTDHSFHMGSKPLIIAMAGKKLYTQIMMRS